MMNNGGYQHMDYTHASNNNMMINNNSNHFMNYSQPHITTTPVVKSHHNTATYSSPTQNGYLQQQIHQTGYLPMDSTTHTMMNNLNSMDIDDYFTPTNMDSMFAANNIYSPSTNSVTTNSSVIMMDTMSPSSPTHMLSPNNTTNNLNHHLMSPTQSMVIIIFNFILNKLLNKMKTCYLLYKIGHNIRITCWNSLPSFVNNR